MPVRERVGRWLAGLLGVVFVAIGINLVISPGSVPGSAFQRMFGVRDALLGAFVLLLLALGERRALWALILAAVALPLLDIAVLAGLSGFGAAACGNLPYELPLLLIAAMFWPVRRARAIA